MAPAVLWKCDGGLPFKRSTQARAAKARARVAATLVGIVVGGEEGIPAGTLIQCTGEVSIDLLLTIAVNTADRIVKHPSKGSSLLTKTLVLPDRPAHTQLHTQAENGKRRA